VSPRILRAAIAAASFAPVACASEPPPAAPPPVQQVVSPLPLLPPTPVDADVAFVHVTLVPMTSPSELPDQTVLVKGDRIVGVGPAATTLPAARARVIDGTGRFLMPGLADMHAHLNDRPSMTLLVANGVTTVRNMWGTRQTLAWKEAIARGELLGPTIHTAGPIVDGAPPVWDGSTPVKDADEARRAVDAQHASGYEFVKVYALLTRDAYDGIVSEAARVGMPVAGHVPRAVGLEHVLESHQKSVEHLDGYFAAAQRDDSPVKGAMEMPQRQRMVDYVDEAKLGKLAIRTREAGTWNCPTLAVYKADLGLDDLKAMFARPELRYMSPQIVAGWDPTKDFRSKNTLNPESFARMRRGYALRVALVKRLHDAGARLLLGTDFPNPFVVPGFSAHDELADLVEAGLTPYEAMRAGTKDAAEYLGDDFGEVAAGKRADLVLVDADPLIDVRNARKRAGVMLRGAWHPEAELREALEKTATAWDPSRDRLAALPPVPGARAYRSTYGGVFAGQERWAVERDKAGGRTIVAQWAYDETEPGSRVLEMREQLDARGAVRAIDVRRDDSSGALTASLAVAGGHLTGDVQLAGGDKTHVAVAVRDPVPLPGPIGGWQVLADRARGLAVKGKLDVDAVDVDVEPTVHLVVFKERIERLPDDHGVRRYAIEEVRPNAKTHFELRVAADGTVDALHVAMQIGEADVTRVR
jgi:imidazolonepropionase-like amidohydrolase